MSWVASEIIEAYYVIGRGRQFVGASVPDLPGTQGYTLKPGQPSPG